MGLFGKKKTPAEILAEGKALYERGDYGQAVILFLKVGRKENGEGDYWAGRGYLARFDQSGRDGDLKAARRHLSLAAGAGHAGAADLLAQRFGTGGPAAPRAEAPAKPVPETPKPAPVPKPEPSKPAPEADTPEALYQKGMGLRDLGRYSAAFPTLLLAAGKGHGKALLQCAIMYQRGEGTAKDLRQALALAEKAKAQGVEGAEGVRADIAAQYVLEPAGGGKPAAQKPAPAPKAEPPKPSPAPEPPKPTPAARPAPAPAGQDGPQPGEEDFQRGSELRKAKDWDGAAAAWTKAAEQGHPEALKKLTGFYAGEFTVWSFRNKESRAKYMDYDKAIQWGTTAMDRGVDVASIIMGAYEKKGQIEKAIDFGEKAVSRGFDAEWKLMYLCIEVGRYEDAIAWGRKYDEKKGTDEAQKRLAQIRKETFDKAVAAHTEKDFPQALSLMEKSAGLGSSTAMFNCGVTYANGEGTAVDMAKALMWFEKAAEQGNAKAQFKCGVMYKNGEGAAADKAKGMMWLEKAAAQGDESAKKVLELMKKLTELQADEAAMRDPKRIEQKLSQGEDLTIEERKYVRENYAFLSAPLRKAYDAYMCKLIDKHKADEAAKKDLELKERLRTLLAEEAVTQDQKRITQKLSQGEDLTTDERKYVRENYEFLPAPLRDAYDAYMCRLMDRLKS